MIHNCAECGKVIEDNSKVSVMVTATYHRLASKILFALEQKDLKVIGPLYHEECDE